MTCKLFLGSGSPRRVALLKQMGIAFEQRVLAVEEVYPQELKGAEITDFLAQLKGKTHQQWLQQNELVLTADTLVWFDDTALGKPKDVAHAIEMLSKLSGKTHEVITSVCLSTNETQMCIQETTQVSMAVLSIADITYYVNTQKPFDKAGGYGIQDWIGLIGVSKIEGSYTNVVGLPTAKTYQLLLPYLPSIEV
jgi:septum formation protein